MKIRRFTISQLLIKAINTVGFTAAFVGLGGLAGNVEQGRNVVVPIIVLVCGALMMWATSLMEIIEDEKRNGHRAYSHHRSDARPYFLR